jgi:hypothetical protein
MLDATKVSGKHWSQAVVPHYLDIVGNAELWEGFRCGTVDESSRLRMLSNHTGYLHLVCINGHITLSSHY